MKRYFALALAVLLLFGLTACAGKTPSTETQTPAASETTPAADSTESGSSEEPIIIHVWSEDIETTLPLNEAFYEYTNYKYKIEYTPIPSTEMVAKVQTALADSIKLLNNANPNDQVVKLKALESFEKAADGQATKIIVPSEIQSLAGLAASFKGLLEDEKK